MTAVPETGNTGQLVLWANPYPAHFTLSATSPTTWRVSAEVTGDIDADLSMEVRRWGALAEHHEGLYIRVEYCTAPWNSPQPSSRSDVPYCTADHGEIVTVEPIGAPRLATDAVYPLGSVEAGEYLHFLVTLWLGSDPSDAPQSTANLTSVVGIGITAVATDEDVSGITVPPQPPTSLIPPEKTPAEKLTADQSTLRPQVSRPFGSPSHSLAATGFFTSHILTFAVGCIIMVSGIALVALNRKDSQRFHARLPLEIAPTNAQSAVDTSEQQ